MGSDGIRWQDALLCLQDSSRNKIRTDVPGLYIVDFHWKWPFIVDFPIKNGGSFHSYVKLPGLYMAFFDPWWTTGKVHNDDIHVTGCRWSPWVKPHRFCQRHHHCICQTQHSPQEHQEHPVSAWSVAIYLSFSDVLSRYRWALPLIPKSSKVISYNKTISSSQKASQWSVALSLLQQLQQQLLPSIVSCCAAVTACRAEQRLGWRRAAEMVLEIRKKKVEVNASLGGHENGWMFWEYASCYTRNFGDEIDAWLLTYMFSRMWNCDEMGRNDLPSQKWMV